ncbi:cilia- and flagella-associated protein 418-like [Clytia hemisphaerica]|uniref:cilia- and flagella-associated protein 418-like n=1 Tax=Clytia hemisphaerica TaxID=252671 RepID=UPI0034D69C11
MGDDIDDLLDEVESKFCTSKKKTNVAKQAVCKSPQRRGTCSAADQPKVQRKKKSSADDNLDDIIDDIMIDDGLNLKSLKISGHQENNISPSRSVNKGLKVKCFAIHIGGTSLVKGPSTSTNTQCCDRMHCTSCDNRIVFFDDYKWDESQCEYLAFRNYYPDFSRLKKILIPRKGYRAFCCQCSWICTKETVFLKDAKPEFKWVCTKH